MDLVKDAEFSLFRVTLDPEMKRHKAKSKKKQAEALSWEEEELLWEKGFLGDTDPKTLLKTIIFFNCFALRSGKEHRQLQISPCLIEVIEREGEKSYLYHVEDGLKVEKYLRRL